MLTDYVIKSSLLSKMINEKEKKCMRRKANGGFMPSEWANARKLALVQVQKKTNSSQNLKYA